MQGDHGSERAQDEPEGLDREVLVVGAVVVAGTVTAILDATIVNVAVPTLGREFAASISTIQWVMTAYLLAFASAIPLTGWASSRIGTKRVWITGLLVFMAGSALAAAAWSIEALIAFRALQGIGAGLLMPVGQTILAQAAGPRRMGRVMSVVGIPMLLAPIFGPVVGGLLVDTASWRWIFLVNIPVGVAAVLLAWRILPASPRRGGLRLDVRGLALLSPGLAILVYGLSEAGTSGGFGTSRVLTLLGVGSALVGLYVVHALGRGRGALVDVSLLSRRGFAAAAATNLLVGIALFGALLLLPLYFQIVRGQSALATGLLLVPQGLGAALAMPIAGRLTDRVGARRVIPAGILLALAGVACYTQVGSDTPYAFLAGALFIIGLGLGSTIMPSMAVAYGSVPRSPSGRRRRRSTSSNGSPARSGRRSSPSCCSARSPGSFLTEPTSRRSRLPSEPTPRRSSRPRSARRSGSPSGSSRSRSCRRSSCRGPRLQR